jgi:acetoacetyl-CoA synthetase
MPTDPALLWTPSPERAAGARMRGFADRLAEAEGVAPGAYRDLHRLSIERPEAFWTALWDFAGVIGERGARVVENGDAMPGARFFPDARLNFAENLLKPGGPETAITFRGEDAVRRSVSRPELEADVSRLQQAFAAVGLRAGDRVAAMMPNMPEAVVAMLAAASLGAVFSSCSPDFGEQGVLDRFGQIEPRVLVVADGYWYNGKRIAIADKVARIREALPSVERVVVVPYLGEAEALAGRLAGAWTWEATLGAHAAAPLRFARLPFDHPLYILYSSGTTGVPKCIVHSAGGALLQHLKEHKLHCDLRPGDRLFFFTTCGWMMWNWLVSGLASGLTLVLYDGSPLVRPEILFDLADEAKITLFGTSAKFIDSVRKAGIEPRRTHDLASVRTICSTGSPLAPEGFEFVYRAIKPDVHLASISGGTDIMACFVLGDPTGPVRRGEIQAPALGMAVDVWDEDGRPAGAGVKGELVCTRPFPSMPLGFWNDPKGEKYRAAYFERFPGVWCHGDFAEWTPHGGMIIHGRSDATLNPGGVRIGTAELYAQVERIPEIAEALAIGQQWDGDVRIVLFVRMQPGAELDEAMEKRIRQAVREGASPRHVPAKIVAVADIPRTKSGKIVELAVRDVVHGREVKNREALANPEALELFKGLPALAS